MIASHWIFTALIVTNQVALALPWSLQTQIQPNAGASLEYEISKDTTFVSSTLVDQGYSQNSLLKGDLPGGLYYLRFRTADANGTPGAWSSPEELTLTNRTSTSFIEPIENTRIESPNIKTAVLYRWKRLEGATFYVLDLKNLGSKESISYKTPNPFFTAELPYGTWSATVQTYFGKKLIASANPVVIIIEPTTQDGAQFLRPQNNDIIVADTKTPIEIKRSYEPSSTTLVIKDISNAQSNDTQSIEISPSKTVMTLPALPPGTYQLTIVDGLKQNASVESNVVIKAEADPLQAGSRGSQTTAEASIGFLSSERSQTNHYLSPNQVRSQNWVDFRMMAIARNAYFDPYQIELRAEGLKSQFDFSNQYPGLENQSHLEALFSGSLLYRLDWPTRPNHVSLRAGFFLKQFHQISETPTAGNTDNGSREILESQIRLYGLITGADWNWRTMSQKWYARASLRLLAPIISSASRVATGAPDLKPAIEISTTFKREIMDFTYFTFSPQLKIERWLNSELDSSRPKSEHDLVGYGLQFGLELDL